MTLPDPAVPCACEHRLVDHELRPSAPLGLTFLGGPVVTSLPPRWGRCGAVLCEPTPHGHVFVRRCLCSGYAPTVSEVLWR